MSGVTLRARLAFCIALAPGVVLAGDTVVVRLLPGYPRSEQSAELIQFRIERLPAAIPGAVQPFIPADRVRRRLGSNLERQGWSLRRQT
jgi:hypothetical protein